MILRKCGNLFEYVHQAYAHGVNSLGRMEAGIAKEFKERYPEMFESYRALCNERKLQGGDVYFYRSDDSSTVFNLVTQSNLKEATLKFLRRSVREMHLIARREGIHDIAIPEIGCGLGGLSLDDLSECLKPFLHDSSHHVTLYQFDGCE